MEMTAILMAMRALPDGAKAVIHSDSQYCVNGLTIWHQGWQRKNWMKKGESASSGAYVEFLEAVKKAEAEAEALRVSRISKAGKEGNWQADAWYLERRYPERWGKRIQQEVTGKDGGPLEYVQRVQELTDSELERIILGRGGTGTTQ
jgi:hypothetical protein